MVFDRSQTITRCQWRNDGHVPTLGTRSVACCLIILFASLLHFLLLHCAVHQLQNFLCQVIHAMRLGRELAPGEIAALFGLPGCADLGEMSSSKVKHFLCNCMHISDIGNTFAMGILSSFGCL